MHSDRRERGGLGLLAMEGLVRPQLIDCMSVHDMQLFWESFIVSYARPSVWPARQKNFAGCQLQIASSTKSRKPD